MKKIYAYFFLFLLPVINFSGGCGGSSTPATTSTQTTSTASWQRYSESPVVLPGFQVTPGGAVGVAASDASVLYDEQEGKWKMWFATGWQEGSIVRIGIKYAESNDGKTWIIIDGLALSPASNATDWDYTNAETPSVVKNTSAPSDKRYMLWYSGGNTTERTLNGYAYYQIGLAYSADGKTFTRTTAAESPYGKAGLVFMVKDAFPAYPEIQDGVLADPEVVLKDGVYHLWMSTIGMKTTGETVTGSISYAKSSNGINWTPSQKNPLSSLMRQNPLTAGLQPSVLWNNSKSVFEMWYTCDTDSERQQLTVPQDGAVGFWHATSANGEDWMNEHDKSRDFTNDKSYTFESVNLETGTEVVLVNDAYYMYYPAYGTKNVPTGFDPPRVWAINLATKK